MSQRVGNNFLIHSEDGLGQNLFGDVCTQPANLPSEVLAALFGYWSWIYQRKKFLPPVFSQTGAKKIIGLRSFLKKNIF